jgi:hypothetical protein
VKRQQLDEATAAEEALRKGRDVVEERFGFYSTIADRTAPETSQLAELGDAQRLQGAAQSEERLGADIVRFVPDVSVGAPTREGRASASSA